MESRPARSAHLVNVGLVGTYPPTRCGIATFTAALRTAMMSTELCSCDVVEVIDRPRLARREVVQQVVAGDETSLAHGADGLARFDAVIVQHEFGIFGGRDGADVLKLVSRVDGALIVVLHTIPRCPSDGQRQVLERLAGEATVVVAMTDMARQRLVSVFDVDASKVLVVPHGAHPNAPRNGHRQTLRPTILTWGLLGPGKGVEAGIEAVAMLRDLVPAPRYVIAGETHPKVRAASGEAYRQSLIDLVSELGIEDLVEFDQTYRDVSSLSELVRSADVVLLPYESREQVTSGVLIDAVASGRPVVATAFPHAAELLADGAGIVVEHGDIAALAAALRTILTNRRVAQRMEDAALLAAEPMLWPTVGATFARLAHLLAIDGRTQVA
jgi:glycosyltransferase involved in cell wall biosynthesis